ncbi:hypothetical protein DV736_g737, partial [Chaetothyriales sp. CBS 134916]
MPALPQYSYIFGFGLIFAFLDAWNIGANDVANSFATSVSSRSLTMLQAMLVATVCEFGGAVLAGSRVSGTIKNNIIPASAFESNPSVLMLGMLCALVGSSLWLTIATKIGLPVSTTHSIVGGIIGVGLLLSAAVGLTGLGGVLDKSSRLGALLLRKNSLIKGLWMIPIYFGVTTAILVMSIVWKGAASLNLDDWRTAPTVGTIFGYWTIKGWEVIKGPMLWFRGEVPPLPEGNTPGVIQDYYRGHATKNDSPDTTSQVDADSDREANEKGALPQAVSETDHDRDTQPPSLKLTRAERAKLDSLKHPWNTPAGFFNRLKYYFLRGVNRDIVEEQGGKDFNPQGFAASFLAKDMSKYHKHVKKYDNKTEHLYSFLQVMTAAVASFGHGANDVSNGVGPLAAIYQIWRTNDAGSKSEVPIWVLAYGGTAITIGLWTYGYNMMRNLGNRLTLHSPSRGFSMELGAALTVVVATRLSLPVSTTQCITGATVGVALCSGTLRAVNWRMVIWIYCGWFLTLPITGIVAGGLMAIIINAPRWGLRPSASSDA